MTPEAKARQLIDQNRLLKFGGAKRVLFLVDTRNLGKQAHQEFMAYTPPDDGRKCTELNNAQRLASPNIDLHARVCISTIQRVYANWSRKAPRTSPRASCWNASPQGTVKPPRARRIKEAA